MNQKKAISVTASEICMDSVVTLHVISRQNRKKTVENMVRAFGMFRYVESICNRFTPDSEVMRLSHKIGKKVEVSPVLFEALKVSLDVAKLTDGAFDPTVGLMYRSNRAHRPRPKEEAAPLLAKSPPQVSYKDIELDPENRTVLLHHPLVIDLGAVAKGLAIDLAAKELGDCHGIYINAGGDFYTSGLNEQSQPWLVKIECPTDPSQIIATLHLTNGAVCTSGLSKSRNLKSEESGHDLPRKTSEPWHPLLCSMVVAPQAIIADTFSTAASIQGAQKGLQFLKRAELDGILITHDFALHATEGMSRYNFKPIHP